MKYTMRYLDYVNEGIGEYEVTSTRLFTTLGDLACFIKKYSLAKQNRILEIVEGDTSEIGKVLSEASDLLGEDLQRL